MEEALWDTLFGAPCSRGGLRTEGPGGWRFDSWGDVMDDAACRARSVRAAGATSGSVVAGALSNTYDAAVGLLAIWRAGAAFASWPHRPRVMAPAAYHRQLASQVRAAGAQAVYVDGEVAVGLPDHLPGVPVHHWPELGRATGRGSGADPSSANGTAVIQYSSGSTGRPKGCVLSATAIERQMRMLAQLTDRDLHEGGLYSWVPLSHDMGLFGGLVFGCFFRLELTLSSPQRFMRSPRSWFRDVAELGAAVTTGTSTALGLAARAHRSELPQRLRLHSALIGAEVIQWHDIVAAGEAFGPSGLGRAALRPCYGMAEATLAVSCSPMGARPQRILLDRRALEQNELAPISEAGAGPGAQPAVALTCSGAPLAGVEVTCASGPGSLGRLSISSPSLADGYLGGQDDAAGLTTGMFHSTDLGFLLDGEVYVVGRADDVHIEAGRNVHLRDLESAIQAELGLGQVPFLLVAMPGAGSDRLVAVAERRGPVAGDLDEVRERIYEAAMAMGGVPVRSLVVVGKGQLPMTPSGKPQRRRCRELLGRGELGVLASTGVWAGGGEEDS